MTPNAIEATVNELVRAHENSQVLRTLIRAIPAGSVATVITHLVLRAYRAENPPQEWAPADARKAHARYERGLRDPWTKAGERSYQREKKRQYANARRTEGTVGGTAHTAPSTHHDERRTG